MNERIKELVEQATERNLDWDSGEEIVQIDIEKFAELIVQKCQTLIEQESDKWRGEEDITNFKLAIAAINEYFNN